MTLTNRRPRVGVSLPPEYFYEEEDQPGCHWRRILGPPEVGLGLLREAGAESIELRMIRPGTPPQRVRRAADVAWEAGFWLTLHGLLHPEGSHPADAGAFPLWELAEEVERVQGAAVVTLHARFAMEERTEEELSRATVAALQELLAEGRRRRASFLYALEINKTKAKVDPSFTWHGVESMVASVDDPKLGICWDFGHAYYNHLKGLIPAQPPEAFVKQVVHTHIHDLGPQAETHWPLGAGGVQVEEFCRQLMAAGYAGAFNLELEPNRFGSGPGMRDRVLASVNRLAAVAAGAAVC